MSIMLATVVGVLWPYMFSIAGSETTFTLTNKTGYFLHAKIENESFVYIAPGGSAIVKVNAPTSVYAAVRYSPGQGVTGTAERTVNINTTTVLSGGTGTCTSNREESTCNSTEPSSTISTVAGRWDVLPSEFKSQ